MSTMKGMMMQCVLCVEESISFACARRDVYTGLIPKGLRSLGGILGGGKSQPIPGKPAVKVGRTVRAAQIQILSSGPHLPQGKWWWWGACRCPAPLLLCSGKRLPMWVSGILPPSLAPE